jgi:hypothetical protein
MLTYSMYDKDLKDLYNRISVYPSISKSVNHIESLSLKIYKEAMSAFVCIYIYILISENQSSDIQPSPSTMKIL